MGELHRDAPCADPRELPVAAHLHLGPALFRGGAAARVQALPARPEAGWRSHRVSSLYRLGPAALQRARNAPSLDHPAIAHRPRSCTNTERASRCGCGSQRAGPVRTGVMIGFRFSMQKATRKKKTKIAPELEG